MELRVNDYVRTNKGNIDKLTDKNIIIYEVALTGFGEKPIKSSPNIIDLIEEGDYVNGLPVERVEGTWDNENDIRIWFGVATYGKKTDLPNHKYIVKDEFENDYELRFRNIAPKDIKSIVTKEQFESMEYKVE